MPTLLETFASYLPALVTHRGTIGVSAPTSPARSSMQAALLFADISGFTALAEQLAQRGPVGVEELTRLLNTSFGQLLDLIEHHGGDVVKFAGDALLAIWPASDEPLADAAQRAGQCALDMHARLTSFYRLIASVQLTLRIGVATGEVTAMHIGGVAGRWELLVVGEPLIQVGAAEQLARPGQVVLTPATWALLSERCIATPLDDSPVPSSYMCLAAISTPLPARRAPPATLAPELEALLRAYIPHAVLSHLVAGQATWLAELRRVTVMFVNLPLVDHTMSLDQAQAVMRTLQGVLYRYEGSLNKISLDDKGVTLVAAFGLPPLAHEDDAARGVQAALVIAQALGQLRMRCAIGVTSGRAFCGEIGSTQRREYTMIGDVVNLAARLMQAATSMDRAGESAAAPLLCDEATAHAAQPQVWFEALPPIVVKGKAEPIPVYRPISPPVVSTISQPSASSVELVGRAAEQVALAEQLHLLVRGEGGVVLIEGEPGMGKSLLLAGLWRQATELGAATLLSASDAMEQSTPYYVWRNIFSQLFDLNPSIDPEAHSRQVFDLLASEDDDRQLAPLLNAVLPLDLPESEMTARMSGHIRAEATRDLLLRLLQRAASRAPRLLILEDGHWFDSASWALALAVSQRVRSLLLVIALRPLVDQASQTDNSMVAPPEYQQLRAAARLRLRLDALAPQEMLALVCRRLGVASLPEPVAALIREKAQGNPFFSEELAYALRDAGLIQIDGGVCQLAPGADLRALTFPETVQGAIISRIDRLTPTQQLTLKVASVIGRVFPVRTLQEVYPVDTSPLHLTSDLTTLTRLEITLLDAPAPDLAYGFKHAITQDAVYNLMLFAQRRQLHRAVAEWYEQVYADRPTWLYPLLAYHWSKADVVAKAVDYLAKAGRHALSSSALREARTLVKQALNLIATPAALPQVQYHRMALLQLLGEAHHQLGDFAAAREALEQGLQLAQAADDHSGMIDALSLLGRVCTDIGAYAEARVRLEQSLELARQAAAPARIAHVLSNLGNVAMRQGAYDQVQRYYQESLSLFAAIGDRPGVAQVLNGMGNGAVDQGMYDTARYCYEESLTTRRAIGDLWGVAGCLSNLGWVAHLQHAYGEARDRYEESLAISRSIGDQRGTAIVLNNLGFTLYELCEDRTAADSFDEALRLSVESGAVPLALEVLVGMARLQARAGHGERAAELLGLAVYHPASNTDVQLQAALFRSELAATLDPERVEAAMERGRTAALDQVVATLVRN